MIRLLLIFSLIFSGSISRSQDQSEEGPTAIEKYGPRRQISTIIYMGLAGAVLGLSTLSFYGRPQDKLSNIPIGFGVGVIVGTVYMTYQAAANPDEFYRQSQQRPNLRDNQPSITMVTDSFYRQDSPSFYYQHQWEF